MIPRITVLMPVYNGIQYLREAIESVLSQTFTDFEFVIIDDGSTDGSITCIESYKDSRIRFVCNEQNMGQARTLNKGIELARGKYIARLDQDDVCLPRRLEAQAAFLEVHPRVAVVCAWEHTINEEGKKIRSWRREIENFGSYLGTLLIGKCPVWHPSVMFCRQVVVDLGGYDPFYAPSDDFDLWSRIAVKGYSGAIVPEFLLLQRRHSAQQTGGKQRPFIEKMRRAHEKMLGSYLSENQVKIVAPILRMDDEFSILGISREYLSTVLKTLHILFSRARDNHALNGEEFAAMKHVIYRRLGYGVKFGEKLVHLPSFFFYLLFFCGSPLLVPKLRRIAMNCYARVCEARYLRTFLRSQLIKWFSPKR